MRRSKSVGNFEPDPEIERTFRVRRQEARKKKEEAKMTDNNNANENLHVIVPDESSIQDHETPNPANCMYKTPAIGATQYNINPSLIQMVSNSSFEGDIEREDPHRHLESFVQMCGSFRINGVTADQIRLHMFPYSIKGKALEWFQQLSDATLATWDNLSTEFLSKYYPSIKTQQMRAIILTFKAQPSEGLYQAWERYKALLRKCPHHGYEEWMVLSTFYGALNSDIRLSLDVAAGGNFKKAPVTQAKALLEELASNNYAWAPSGTSSVKSAQDTEMMNLLTLKLDALTQEVRGQRANVNAISTPMEGYNDPGTDQYLHAQQFPEEARTDQALQKDELVESEAEISEKENDEQKEDEIAPKVPVKPYVPPIPFPQRLHNKKLEKQYEKFLQTFRQLHINIPFADALAQMPLYAKFLKEMLSRKRKLEDVETITLNAECSAVIQKSIPQKLKDPGSFSLPCTIGKMENIKALCDLGASVSLMPYSICKRLGLGELKKTRISLQLADRTIKHPLGVIEDVLVKVDKFFIPCDFVVLDMDEDVEMPIILGRPFLATARTTIDVKAGKLTSNVGD
nr:PREDICTED: uncharacterized protein LOC108221447 [Daucus carota subsp. sativus]